MEQTPTSTPLSSLNCLSWFTLRNVKETRRWKFLLPCCKLKIPFPYLSFHVGLVRRGMVLTTFIEFLDLNKDCSASSIDTPIDKAGINSIGWSGWWQVGRSWRSQTVSFQREHLKVKKKKKKKKNGGREGEEGKWICLPINWFGKGKDMQIRFTGLHIAGGKHHCCNDGLINCGHRYV